MNASIVSSSFPQSTIDSYANIFSSITSSSQSSLSAVNNTIANIATLTDPTLQQASSSDTLNTKKQSVSDQKYALEQAQRDLIKLQNDKIYSSDTYDSQIVSQDNSIRDANNSLKYAQASLDLLKAGATQTEIALAKNSITSGQISLQKVKEGITKYQLEAPFDGVVRKIDFKLGDNIVTSSSSTIAYLYIENPNLVEITATVDQLEVVKLKLGQDAKIVFDSFSTLTFTGKVSDINSTPTQTS
ncbi:HlyD family efflux transporter periplasmic adaptor subunit [bacterium]|nr:HlyD family efflux transporter periplasmic adaptor subunit [bacterium]